VHSLVQYRDGSVKAQLGEPDMRLPIQVALTYPDRAPAQPAPALDLAARGTLHFEAIDLERYPALGVALAAGRRDDTTAAAISGADDACKFTDIARLLARALDAHVARGASAGTELEELLDAEAWGRRFIDETIGAGVSR
jgi:1-deoxy-D-xylulose-5-phosphate reductoisomerase